MMIPERIFEVWFEVLLCSVPCYPVIKYTQLIISLHCSHLGCDAVSSGGWLTRF